MQPPWAYWEYVLAVAVAGSAVLTGFGAMDLYRALKEEEFVRRVFRERLLWEANRIVDLLANQACSPKHDEMLSAWRSSWSKDQQAAIASFRELLADVLSGEGVDDAKALSPSLKLAIHNWLEAATPVWSDEIMARAGDIVKDVLEYHISDADSVQRFMYWPHEGEGQQAAVKRLRQMLQEARSAVPFEEALALRVDAWLHQTAPTTERRIMTNYRQLFALPRLALAAAVMLATWVVVYGVKAM